MAAIVDRYRVGKEYDRRRKLTDEQKEEIRRLRELGLSLKEIAEAYGVSRRLVQFICDPAKEEENKKRRQERGGWRQYYDPNTHAKTMREHRLYKQKLLAEGVL